MTTTKLPARTDEIRAAEADAQAQRAKSLAQSEWRLAQRAVAAPRQVSFTTPYYNAGDFVPAGSPVVSILPPGQRQGALLRVRADARTHCTRHVGEARLRRLRRADSGDGRLRVATAPNTRRRYSIRRKTAASSCSWSRRGRAADAAKLQTGQPVDVDAAVNARAPLPTRAPDAVIDVRGLNKHFGTQSRRARRRACGAARRDLRLPRPERQRQDDDDPHALRAAHARCAARAPASATTSSRETRGDQAPASAT